MTITIINILKLSLFFGKGKEYLSVKNLVLIEYYYILKIFK